jgi:hypothetical protein
MVSFFFVFLSKCMLIKEARMKTKYLNFGLVICLVLGILLTATPVKAQVPTTWPPDSFWNEPQDPSIFDWISFGLYDYPPAEWKCVWSFGDGSTYNECWVNASKRYTADGYYTVNVLVTNELDETVSVTRVVSVSTHDVAITKITVPQTARVGQTRQITVSVRNSRYPESVMVDLWKSIAGDYAGVGSSTQLVPVRSANRTTAFTFNYTFTAEDARLGKVTFKAIATLLEVRDALPADNVVITLPTRVTR